MKIEDGVFKSFLIRRMPASLHLKLKYIAAQRSAQGKNVSMEQVIIDLLTKAVKDATE